MLAQNKKAYHDYHVLDTFEAGFMLSGSEVKAIRQGLCNLKGAFVDVFNGESWANGIHISPYSHSQIKDYNPVRKRKLLLNKREIAKIEQQISEKGVTAVPLEIYLKNNRIKVKIGICRGKKLHDKREDLKRKSQQMEMAKALKRFS